MREIVVAAFQHRGSTVIAVATRQETLDVIAARGSEIAVPLTDVVMPGIGGIELLGRACQARPDLRAIFMSGYTALTLD